MSHGLKDNSILDEQKRLAARKQALWLRSRMSHAIRQFFIERDYLEVETPHLIPAPPPEVHIDVISAGDLFLQTSPELYMKRLLSAGFDGIFQICRCFRQGERGRLHLPEFTRLEWYRTGLDYKDRMEECEELISHLTLSLDSATGIGFQGKRISLERPWEKITVTQAFNDYASMPLKDALENGCFDEILVKEIEPCLGITRPTFLYDYPASMGALARVKPDDPRFAERFEIYMGGIELANGFSELTDGQEQRRRFERDEKKRRLMGGRPYPMPEKFLRFLEQMPEAAGIAMGIDRLAMIFSDAEKIDDVVPFTPEDL